jgi:hypothetical protein
VGVGYGAIEPRESQRAFSAFAPSPPPPPHTLHSTTPTQCLFSEYPSQHQHHPVPPPCPHSTCAFLVYIVCPHMLFPHHNPLHPSPPSLLRESQAANIRGVSLASGAKAMLMDTGSTNPGERYALLVLSATQKLDYKVGLTEGEAGLSLSPPPTPTCARDCGMRISRCNARATHVCVCVGGGGWGVGVVASTDRGVCGCAGWTMW